MCLTHQQRAIVARADATVEAAMIMHHAIFGDELRVNGVDDQVIRGALAFLADHNHELLADKSQVIAMLTAAHPSSAIAPAYRARGG
jgi:hypothetical protein